MNRFYMQCERAQEVGKVSRKGMYFVTITKIMRDEQLQYPITVILKRFKILLVSYNTKMKQELKSYNRNHKW